jgi:ACS family tartrate transporter-like MFS transporter
MNPGTPESPATLDMVNIPAMDRKIWWRIIPFVVLLYVISILDRVNIGYAALTMNADLGIDPYAFGLISGIFFVSYVIFEVPSNQFLARTGARLWLFRIMVSWGIIAILMAVVQTPFQLGILRFLLGAAEAGFAPGLILYLSFWFRKEGISRALAVFFMAIPLTMVIASPLSTYILSSISWLGVAGWRWLFILEGVPAIILGCAILVVLPDLPDRAAWLSLEEKAWLAERLEGAQVSKESAGPVPFRQLVATPTVPLLCAGAFLVGLFLTGLLFWIPQIIQASGLSRSLTETGLLVMIPYGISAVGMYYWSRHSDRQGERVWHVVVPWIAAAVLLIVLSVPLAAGISYILLTGAIVACYACYAPFFVITVENFPPSLRASGTALVNTVASVGAFLGPVLFGLTGGKIGGSLSLFLFPALGLALIACAVFFIRKKPVLIAGKTRDT